MPLWRNAGDLHGAALTDLHFLALETQHVQHRGGGVAARVDAPFFVRDRPQPERAEEIQQLFAEIFPQRGFDEVRVVIVIRRDLHVGEIASPVAGFEQLFADAVCLFKNHNVRPGAPGGDRRA